MTKWVKANTGKVSLVNHLIVMEPLKPEKTTLNLPVVFGLKMTRYCVQQQRKCLKFYDFSLSDPSIRKGETLSLFIFPWKPCGYKVCLRVIFDPAVKITVTE